MPGTSPWGHPCSGHHQRNLARALYHGDIALADPGRCAQGHPRPPLVRPADAGPNRGATTWCSAHRSRRTARGVTNAAVAAAATWRGPDRADLVRRGVVSGVGGQGGVMAAEPWE